MPNEYGYLINKSGGGYYRDKARGYTLNTSDAGRFSLEDAIAYSHPNGPDGPRDGITYKHESEVVAGSDCADDLRIHDLTQERDRLRDGQEMLSRDLSSALAKIENLEAVIRGHESACDFMARINA